MRAVVPLPGIPEICLPDYTNIRAHPAPRRVALLADLVAAGIQHQRCGAEVVVDQVLRSRAVVHRNAGPRDGVVAGDGLGGRRG